MQRVGGATALGHGHRRSCNLRRGERGCHRRADHGRCRTGLARPSRAARAPRRQHRPRPVCRWLASVGVMTAHLLAAAGGADSPSWLWYATRGLCAATLVVLTGTLVLGITTATKWVGESTPGFVAADMHRNLSLLGMCLLFAHIVTTVLDPFAHITVRDVIIPVGAAYRPVWLGLGVAATWVLVGVVATSLLRERVGLG